MSDVRADAAQPFSGRTAWARSLERPLRDFLTTETGSAAILLAATVVALVWVNVDAARTSRCGGRSSRSASAATAIALDLREWVNSGLMTFFFFVVGLEARREFDIGELRERRRVTLPLIAGLGGMAVPVLIYLAVNAGHGSAHGWGTAMSTDTAFALGMLALVGPRFPERLRSFMLTVVVVDDVAALIGDRDRLHRRRVAARRSPSPRCSCSCSCSRCARPAIQYGLVLRAAGRGALGGAPEVGHRPDPARASPWASSPTPTRRRAPTSSARATCSACSASSRRPSSPARRRWGCSRRSRPNERLLQVFHPWTSYVIVPLFALANAGIPLSGELPAPRVHVADHARDPGRLRRRQADRRGRRAPGS